MCIASYLKLLHRSKFNYHLLQSIQKNLENIEQCFHTISTDVFTSYASTYDPYEGKKIGVLESMWNVEFCATSQMDPLDIPLTWEILTHELVTTSENARYLLIAKDATNLASKK